jgi:dCTP deaminase
MSEETSRCSFGNLSILNDEEIEQLCTFGTPLLDPFVNKQVSDGVISYGLSSFGYDIRISSEFRVFFPYGNIKAVEKGNIVDPKNFNQGLLMEHKGNVIIPPNSFCLGVSLERFSMPENLLGICIGKSTYARCGIVVNVTPIEPGWTGHLTIEISNTTPLPVKIYAGEGIAQVMFFRGATPRVTYASRAGKYQSEDPVPQAPKVVCVEESGSESVFDRLGSNDKSDMVDLFHTVTCVKCSSMLDARQRRTDRLCMCDPCARVYLRDLVLSMASH